MEQQGRLSLSGDSKKYGEGSILGEFKRSGTFPGMNVTNQGDTEMGEHTVDSFFFNNL